MALVFFAITVLAGESAEAVNAPAEAKRTIPDLALDLLWVAPGTFTMGSSSKEPDRHKAEGPQTRVTVSHRFWLGRTEVTQGQYEAITGTNPCNFKGLGANGPVEHVCG